jgi:hypothetical protein
MRRYSVLSHEILSGCVQPQNATTLSEGTMENKDSGIRGARLDAGASTRKGGSKEIISRQVDHPIVSRVRDTVKKNPHAVALGKRGGKVKSRAKSRASRKNGKLGGRPRTIQSYDNSIRIALALPKPKSCDICAGHGVDLMGRPCARGCSLKSCRQTPA